MAWFPVLILLVSTLSEGYSKTVYCDQTHCDFPTCNNGNVCRNNQYICTEKASQCLLQCNSNCHSISITSFAQYTEITCNNEQSCDDIQVSIPQPHLYLHLECKKRLSCFNIDIESNALSTFQCQSPDQSQCANHVNIVWLPTTTTTTRQPTPNPTSIQPTTEPPISFPTQYLLPSTSPTAKPTLVPTLNPTIKAISTVITAPPNPTPTMQRLTEIIVITKTVVVFAKQTTSKPYQTVVLLCAVFGVTLCIVAVIYVKIIKKADAKRLAQTPNGKQRVSDAEYEDVDAVGAQGTNSYQYSPSSDIYTPRQPSEGDMQLSPTEAIECAQRGEIAKCSYDGLYEGHNRWLGPTKHYTELYPEMDHEDPFDEVDIVVVDTQTPQASTIGMDFEDPCLPDEMTVGSVSSDNLNLLYGPGAGRYRTPGEM